MRRLLACLLAAAAALPAQRPTDPAAPRFGNGLPHDPSFFPIAVWLQAPHHAARYRDVGINLYVGLWEGPTQAQLDALREARMRVICEPNDVGLAYEPGTIVGWMQVDEPDNAQATAFGYGAPIAPDEIARRYEAMRKRDPTRPVFLNLGQGAAWDGWHGRGVRTNHPEDYAEYLKGCDIASFDIYPVTHTHADVQGRLEFVARGVQRLRAACRDKKPVWACIETTHIDNPKVRPTPQQVRDEVWIAVCAGASGIVYFAHEFAPEFVEAGLLRHEDVLHGVAAANGELTRFAPALNAPRADDAVTVTAEPAAELAVRVHRHAGALHVFVASLVPGPVTANVRVRGRTEGEVSLDGGEARPFSAGTFALALRGYGHAHAAVTP